MLEWPASHHRDLDALAGDAGAVRPVGIAAERHAGRHASASTPCRREHRRRHLVPGLLERDALDQLAESPVERGLINPDCAVSGAIDEGRRVLLLAGL